jgi:hypothetical protein
MNPRYHMVGIDMRRTCERVQANTRSGVAIAQLSLLGNPQAVQAGDDVNASWLGAAATAKLGATDTDFDHTSRRTIMHIIAEQVSSRVLRCGNCPMPLAHSLLSRNDAVGIGSAPSRPASAHPTRAPIGLAASLRFQREGAPDCSRGGCAPHHDLLHRSGLGDLLPVASAS